MAGSTTRRVSLRVRLSLLLASLLVPLMVLEVGLRIWTPGWLLVRMQDARSGGAAHDEGADRSDGSDRNFPIVRNNDGILTGFEPNTAWDMVTPEYRNRIATDELGCRVSGSGEHPNEPLLPFIGDSFVFGVGLDDDQTFSSLMQHKLSMRIVNAGVPGSSVLPEARLFGANARQWGKPSRAVLFVYLGNDTVDTVKRVGAGQKKASSKPGPWLIWFNSLFARAPLKYSYAAGWIKRCAVNIYNSSSDGKHFTTELDAVLIANKEAQEGALEIAVEVLRRIFEEQNSELLVVLIPARDHIDAERFASMLEYAGVDRSEVDVGQPARLCRSVFESAGMEVLDTTEAITNAGGSDLYYKADNHFTARGSAAFVQIIEESVVEWVTR